MNSNFKYTGGFRSGDRVAVVDGTFDGMTGIVVGPEEAKVLRDQNGGQWPQHDDPPDSVWVVLIVFERLMPILLRSFQIRKT